MKSRAGKAAARPKGSAAAEVAERNPGAGKPGKRDPGERPNAVEPHASASLPIVGLGGSAGSISALQSFFRTMPPDSGMDPRRALKLPPEDEPKPSEPSRASERKRNCSEVLAFLRTRTGRDFSYYERATILRRIGRRMQFDGVDRTAGLPRGPAHECRGSRCAAAGHADQRHQLLPRARMPLKCSQTTSRDCSMTESMSDAIRVSVPACATSEEAYSMRDHLLCRIRAPDPGATAHTDLRDRSRRGRDPRRSAKAYSPKSLRPKTCQEDRLEGFFTRERHGYRVPPRSIAKQSALCVARRDARLAVFAARPHLLPQSADLPRTATRSISCSASCVLRAAPRGSSVSRRVRGRRRRQRTVRAARQEEPTLRPGGRRHGPDGRYRPEPARWRECSTSVRSAEAQAEVETVERHHH